MKVSMTHAEACEIVEEAIKCMLGELNHVYVHKCRDGVKTARAISKANVLLNIDNYGAYLKGARAMYRALKERGFLEQPPRDKVVNEAMLSAYMHGGTRNLEWLLEGLPQGVEIYTEIERDKRGKVKSAKSKFVKKEIKLKEI